MGRSGREARTGGLGWWHSLLNQRSRWASSNFCSKMTLATAGMAKHTVTQFWVWVWLIRCVIQSIIKSQRKIWFLIPHPHKLPGTGLSHFISTLVLYKIIFHFIFLRWGSGGSESLVKRVSNLTLSNVCTSLASWPGDKWCVGIPSGILRNQLGEDKARIRQLRVQDENYATVPIMWIKNNILPGTSGMNCCGQ